MWITSGFLVYFLIGFTKATLDYLQHPVQTCRIGDVVENECNKCLCTTKSVFECTPKNCNNNQNMKEHETSQQKCLPNQLYVQNLITCICTKDGKWPHKSCHETFLSLPPSKVVKNQCTPDTYVPVDCNVCKCGPEGEIFGDRCTRNICEEDNRRRANSGSNMVYSKCEMKNWYSLAPCQFCFCVNQNKLVCNTGNYYSKKLDLGSYSLRVCGKDLIKEAIELIPVIDPLRNNSKDVGVSIPVPTKDNVIAVEPNINITNNAKHNLTFEVNRESNENQMAQLKAEESDKEYYTDSNDELQRPPIRPKSALGDSLPTISIPLKFAVHQKSTTIPTTVITTTEPVQDKLQSTLLPFQDDEISESNFKTIDDDDLDEGDSAEILVEIDKVPVNPMNANTPIENNIITNTENTNKNVLKERADSFQYYGNTFKINLPKVLNKVFELALRKSMVSLSTSTECKPGTSTMGSCNNMCFCLKNSKLLCTNNKCKEN